MKPLPEAVQKAFPREAGDVPSRPWWYKSREGRSGADCYRRTDDPHTTALTVEEVAAYDAAHPLPHPGYRAGQVWAHEDGASLTIVQAERTGLYAGRSEWWANYEFARAYPYLMADPSCPHLAPWSPTEKTP